jgi:hypothetical protein
MRNIGAARKTGTRVTGDRTRELSQIANFPSERRPPRGGYHVTLIPVVTPL